MKTNSRTVIGAIIGAVLFGVVAWLVLKDAVWPISFALMGAILGATTASFMGGSRRSKGDDPADG